MANTGSNRDVLVDNLTQQMIDEQVVDLQHKWNVDAVMDAIAKSEWEGQMAIDKMAFDANNQIMGIKNGATLSAFSTLSNSMLDMISQLNNTYHTMESIYLQGSGQAATYQSAGGAEETKGTIKAGSSLISSALKFGSAAGWFSGGTTKAPSFASSVMQGIAGGQSSGESIMNYKAPNLMSSWTPGSSLLGE